MTVNNRETYLIRGPREPEFLAADDLVQLATMTWRRKWLILLVTGLAVACGALYCLFASPVYQSTAQILVMKVVPQGSSPGQMRWYYFDDDVSAHLSVIKSPWFITDMIERNELEALPSVAQATNSARAIARGISVASEFKETEIPRPTSVLNLSYQSSVREDCRPIINALIKHYELFLAETSRTINEDALKLLTQKAEETRKELERLQAAHQEFRKTTPLMWNREQGSDWYQEQLAQSELKRRDAAVRRAGLEAHLDALRHAVEAGADPATLTAMAPEHYQRDLASIRERTLLPLLQQEHRLREDYGYGDGHPELKALREQIELTNRFLAPPPTASASGASKKQATEQHLADPVEAYRQYLEQELREVTASEKVLAEQCEQQRKEAKDLAYYEFLDQRHTAKIDQVSKYYDSLIQQLRGIDVNKDLVGYRMRVIAPPGAGVQVVPRVPLVFSLAAALGLLAGFGLAWIADTRDKYLRTPENLHRRLGLPVVGCIPQLPHSQSTALVPILAALHYPESAEAEAYRAVSMTLNFSLRTEKLKVIQITSPNPHDGKTTVAANLAISLAQSGKRVLLIDADLQRPRVHELFACSTETGLTSVLRAEALLADAIQASEIPDLWVLPSGPPASDPADLLAAPAFHQLLDDASRQYDLVLIDTPALLSVADPSLVASQVDGVLLVVHAVQHGRPQVRRALEILQHLEANLLGAVINATDAAAPGLPVL